ncbi:MAG: CRISPR-associated DNA-binding protein [Candidatus Aramenus sulfurataquae]|uniref:CRISPR-associated DNA-binding protein n=3 Tax=Candidatus Aramenus sulfurataquae TaxID=1326980 RepID=W7KJH5_9CREN|nr:MAG: CRISPR-associated DNA-binding protein [Candidatus Aramenus sulfurataquae]
MALFISPIGFDEKFLVRAFWRRGKAQIEEVLLVKPKDKNEKAEKALLSFLQLLNEVQVQHKVLEVNPSDFVESVSTIAKELITTKRTSYILNLSSGMRVISLEILTAFLLLGLDAEIEVELENQEGIATWRIRDMLRGEVDTSTDVKILEAVEKGADTISDVARATKYPVATVWRKVNRLADEGYLTKDGDKSLQLTTKGKIFIKLYSYE